MFVVGGVAPTYALNARQDPDVAVSLAPPLGARDTGHAVLDPRPLYYSHDYARDRIYDPAAVAPPQTTTNAAGCRNILPATRVRRLTPRECERLQGFPDDWTDVPWRGKAHSPDGHRYKAMGNSMAVPVMRWLGRRIAGLGK